MNIPNASSRDDVPGYHTPYVSPTHNLDVANQADSYTSPAQFSPAQRQPRCSNIARHHVLVRSERYPDEGAQVENPSIGIRAKLTNSPKRVWLPILWQGRFPENRSLFRMEK